MPPVSRLRLCWLRHSHQRHHHDSGKRHRHEPPAVLDCDHQPGKRLKRTAYKRTCIPSPALSATFLRVLPLSFCALHCWRPDSDPIHLARDLFRKRRNIRQALGKLPGQLLVALQQRPSFVLLQEPGAVFPLPWKRRADPVGQWRRHDPDRLGGLGLLPNHQQHLRTAPFSRSAESLHLVHRYRIQVQVVDQRGHISGLLPDDLRARVLQNAGPVDPRLKLRADEVFNRLADAPYT